MKLVNRELDALDPQVERLFSYLDGELDVEAEAEFVREIAADTALAARVSTFRVLFSALDELEPFSPAPDFKIRVLMSLAVRPSLRARLLGLFRGLGHQRVPNPLSAWVEGRLPKRHAAALASLVARDPEARAALTSWRELHDRLQSLETFEPSAGFKDRVMARVESSAAPVPLRTRLARLWPRRRERLAVASGIAFGPTAVVAATAYMVLSNPLVTPSNVLSFVWAKGGAALGAIAQGLMGSATVRSVSSAYDGLTATAPLLAVGLLLFAGLTLISGWILYKNVVNVTPMDGQYVPV